MKHTLIVRAAIKLILMLAAFAAWAERGRRRSKGIKVAAGL